MSHSPADCIKFGCQTTSKSDEQWRQIPGYPGYEASTEGRIRSVFVHVLKPKLTHKTMNDDPEYEILAIRGRRVLVHRLVALAFLGERPVEMEVHHKDHSKRNNKPINLEYVSRSENIRHAYRAGRIEHKFKLHAKQQQRIIEMYETGRYKPKQLAAQFGVDRATIYYLFRLANVKLRPVGKMRKLTTEQYDEIRRKWIPHRYSARQLAEEYSVSHALVEWILGMRTNRGKPCTIGHPELVNTRHATKIANHAQERESAANVAAEARNG